MFADLLTYLPRIFSCLPTKFDPLVSINDRSRNPIQSHGSYSSCALKRIYKRASGSIFKSKSWESDFLTYFTYRYAAPWSSSLSSSAGVAGIADDLIPPCCPVCCVVLFQPRLCQGSLTRIFFISGLATLFFKP